MSLLQEMENRASLMPATGARRSRLLVWSARSPDVLDQMTANLADHLTKHPALELDDVAFTLQLGRQHFDHRRALVCYNRQEALEALAGNFPENSHKAKAADPVFLIGDPTRLCLPVFATLYETPGVFRDVVDRAVMDWRHSLGPDPVSLVKGSETGSVPGPAGLVVAYAQTRLWQSWGVHPKSMFGQGLGEVVCALLAESLSLKTALDLAASWHRDVAGSSVVVALEAQPPKIPFISSLTGLPATVAELADAAYWPRLQRDSGLSYNQADPGAPLLEFAAPGSFVVEGARHLFPALPAGTDPRFSLTLGALYQAGIDPNWRAFRANRGGRRTPLPGYPFKRERYWFTPKPVSLAATPPVTPQQPTGEMETDIDNMPEEKLDEMIAFFERALASGKNGAEAEPAQADQNARFGSLEDMILDLCCNLLGGVDMGIEDNITLFGADSMFTMQLSKKLAELFKVDISAHHLFVEPTIASLAQTLRRHGVTYP